MNTTDKKRRPIMIYLVEENPLSVRRLIELACQASGNEESTIIRVYLPNEYNWQESFV